MLAPSNMGWAGPAALPFARCRWRGPPCTGGGCLDDPPRCATAVCRLFFHPHESTSWGPRAAISPCTSLASLWSFWCLSGTLPLQAQEAPRPCRAVAPSCFAPKATLRVAAQRLRRGHGFPFPQGCPEPLGFRETGQVGQYFGAFTAELYNRSCNTSNPWIGSSPLLRKSTTSLSPCHPAWRSRWARYQEYLAPCMPPSTQLCLDRLC